jgi:zinc transport system permease protein
LIGALWAVGMAAGILFIARTPGFNEDLMSYLFGNILMVSRQQLWMLLILDGVVLLCGILLYNQLWAVCFDEQFARIRGLHVDLLYILLLLLTALTVVVLTTVVGIVLVIALLTLPAAIAGQLSRRLWQMMLWAAVLCILFSVSGLAISYGLDCPAGATIILVAGVCYLLSLMGKALWGVIR